MLGADSSHSSNWDDIISHAIAYTRCSNVLEVFIAAELQSWAKLHVSAERLRLLPLPVNLVTVGPTSELLKRPLSAIGTTTVIELQRGNTEPNGRYTLEIPYRDDRELLLEILKHAGEVEVLAPEALRVRVRQAHDAGAERNG